MKKLIVGSVKHAYGSSTTEIASAAKAHAAHTILVPQDAGCSLMTLFLRPFIFVGAK